MCENVCFMALLIPAFNSPKPIAADVWCVQVT